jgi:hypothetical protein
LLTAERKTKSPKVNATSIWAVVGQIAVVVGVIGSILAIVRHFRTPQERLEAVVRPNAFDLPFKTQDCLLAFYDHLNAPSASNTDEMYRISRSNVIARFNDEWKFGISTIIDHCTAMATMRIDNVGSKKCSGVNLTTPEDCVIVIWQKSNIPTLVVRQHDINLGDLAPKQSIDVWVWSSGSRWSYYSGLRVTHDNGLAKLRYAYTSSSFGKKLENLGTIVVFGGLILAVFLALIFGLRMCASFSEHKPKTPVHGTPTAAPK